MWAIWRQWHSVDEFGKRHHSGDWACDADEDIVTFDTKAEADRVAAMWTATSAGWVYWALPF